MRNNNENRLSIAIRTSRSNENHHLWNNNGTWWINFTLRFLDGTTLRHRQSLKTSDVDKARTKRDRLLRALIHSSGRIAA